LITQLFGLPKTKRQLFLKTHCHDKKKMNMPWPKRFKHPFPAPDVIKETEIKKPNNQF